MSTARQPEKRAGRPFDARKDRDIIEAARGLAFSDEPQMLTMERVAQRAGVSKATLYARYANRHRLLHAVLVSEAMTVYKPLASAPENYAQVQSGLHRFVETAVEYLCGRRHQRLMHALSVLPSKDQTVAQAFRDALDKTLAILAAYLEMAAQRRLIRCPVPAESAEMLLGMATGCDLLRLAYRLGPQRRTAAQRREHAIRVVEAFLSLHAAAPLRPRR